MRCVADNEKKWCKFHKLIANDPGANIVLFSVPRGFGVENLNSFRDGDKELNLRE